LTIVTLEAMDLFTGVLPFVTTAEERSFRRAAARLAVTPAAVSKAVAKLEAELGVTLLQRTSRHVSLTPEGDAFFARCRGAVAEVQAGRELLAESRSVAQGTLRITMSPVLAELVGPEIAKLGARHPRLAFDVRLGDRFSRLAEEGIDVAVRIGALEDSSLVARPLRTPRWLTVAAPTYLARAGMPLHHEELAGHACLVFLTPRGVPQPWWFGGQGQRKAVAFTPRASFQSDSGALLVQMAAAGLGVVQALDFMAKDLVAAGRLTPLVEGEATDGPPIHALVLARRQRAPRVRAFLELLDEVLGRRAT
jgi:LysR family transcriptional regulator, regulator for bpeEF and oprC